MVRCYRYALQPSVTQVAAIGRVCKAARGYWNGLVAAQRWAEVEIRHGRQSSVVAKYCNLLQNKALTGRAVSIARKRAGEGGISLEDAIRELRDEKADKLDVGVVGKNGKRIRFLSRRKLAVEYAIESVEATRKSKGSRLPAAVAYSLLQKFQDSTAQYIRGKRKRPRFKSRLDGISLQAQLQATAPWPLSQDRQGKTFVDLGRIAGETCGKIAVVFHRDIPGGAEIKQVALTIRGERIYAVLMIEAPDAVLEKQFPDAGGRVAGIDPGRKVALSLSTPDGSEKEIIQPSLARDRGFLRKLKRLQRKADRQRRAANPDCYNADGTWIRGKRPVNRSRNLEETERQIAEMQQHLADARLDFYHRTANDLLTRYDAVGIGKWRGRGHAPGEGKSKRAQNRKDYDHAISLYAEILRYKAAGAKRIMDVHEHGSTRDCLECKAPTGPTGLAGLKVRQWTCSRCGTVHERDFAAARAIAQRAASTLAAEAHPPRSQDISAKNGKIEPQRRRSPKDQTKATPPEGARVPVVDEAAAARPATQIKPPSTASAAVPEQEPGGARASQTPVAPRDSNINWRSHLRQPAVGRGPLAACAVDNSS